VGFCTGICGPCVFTDMLLALAKPDMRKILITTTETLSGWEIDSYIKPIFASAVIGAGLFADFSASISDVFGGRSGRYEKKLQVIKEEAIASLTYKATELGANCILGLKIDVDEVSGKHAAIYGNGNRYGRYRQERKEL